MNKKYSVFTLLCCLTLSLTGADNNPRALARIANQRLEALEENYTELADLQRTHCILWTPTAQKIIWGTAQAIGPILFTIYTAGAVYKYNNGCEL